MARQRRAVGGRISEPPTDDRDSRDQDADPEAVARTICLRLLTIRARTRSELHDALLARNVPADVADRVLDRLASVGLVDDQAFAARFVETRHQDRGLAGRELARQLRDKGIEESVIADAVSTVDADQELATARKLVKRKLATMTRLDPQVQTRRLAGLLARKGYAPSTAFQIVREVIGEVAAGTDSEDTAWLA